VVKVLDFGISKSVLGGSVNDMSLTRTSSLIGSPLYMSPEQMKSARDVDSRTDIWALGAILFEMLAGRPPYVAESIPQLCASLLNDAPPPLGDFRADIPHGLEQVMLRCLAKDRTQRWPTVADLAQNLAIFAPPYSRIHADRARRVLGSTEVSAPQPLIGMDGNPGTTLLTSQPSSPGAGSMARTPTPSGSSSGQPPRTGGTLASWGKTGESDDARQHARKKRRIAFVAAGAVALLGAGALLAVFKLRGPGPEDGALPPVAAAEALPAAASAALANAPPQPEITPIGAQAVLPEAAGEATDGGAKTQPRGAAKRPLRVVRRALDKSAAPADAQNKSVPSTISDFGGRR
jgi:serine/threonine-protein kinase